MKKLMTLATAFMLTSSVVFAQNNWTLDMSHSRVAFAVQHMGVSVTEGQFKDVTGTVTAEKEDFSDMALDITIKVNSIDSENEGRDKHLQSPEFFDVENHPDMTFKSSKVMAGKDGTITITGDLTIKGITKEVELEGKGAGRIVIDPWGNRRTGFRLTGMVKRTDFGIQYDTTLEDGSFAIADDVELIINVELLKKK
jgi:polyisoprenoid-binding protein YceI